MTYSYLNVLIVSICIAISTKMLLVFIPWRFWKLWKLLPRKVSLSLVEEV